MGILALLKEEAEQKGLSFVNLIGESQFLINFKRGETEYAHLSFGGNPTHVTEIVQKNQNGYPEFNGAQIGHKGWLTEWGSVGAVEEVSVFDEITPDLNRSTVAYVCERCSIVSKFIVGYHYEMRRELFERDPFPAMSDSRIRVPPSDETFRRARYLWLGALALQNPALGWVFLGRDPPRYEFTYTKQDKHGFAFSRKWSSSADFEKATWPLAYQTEVMDAIELSIRNYLRDNLGAAATKIKETVELVNEKIEGTDQSGNLLQLNIYNVNYENTLSSLVEFAARFDIPLPKVNHRYAQFVKAGEILAGRNVKADLNGWYCTRCGQSFGLNMPLREGKCENCGNPFGSDHVIESEAM